MKKVYLTFEKDDSGNNQVDRVFRHKSDARMYVVTEYMIEEAQNGDEFKKMMDEQIEGHEIIEELKEFKLK